MPYNTTTELTDYATARGITLTGDLSVLLQLANDFIERQVYKGRRTDPEQVTSFPRTGLVIDGAPLNVAIIPREIKAAECESAIILDTGGDLMPSLEAQVKREKVDVLEVEYQDGARSQAYHQKVMSLLNPFLAATGNSVRVTRA
jgi:hypothetical protein